ncbi:nose resistant to fluoxetine protein 6 [Trichonephila clavipes]|nr:nose resistant to fluoxetine protein 6 [Trichonephila clavipes]
MLHTWYVSVVVQLYILALIFIFLLIRSKKIGIILNIFIIFASIAYTGVATYFYDLQPTMTVVHIDEEDSSLFFTYSFANTISRAGPYFVGILIGYILVTKPDIKIPKEMLVMGWFLAVLSSGLTVLITGVWYGVEKPTALQSVIYSAFYKVAFTAGVAWVTFCCTTGHAGNYRHHVREQTPLFSPSCFKSKTVHNSALFLVYRALGVKPPSAMCS